MKKVLYVALPSSPDQRQALLEAAGEHCRVVFQDDCGETDQAAVFPEVTAYFGEPSSERLRRMPRLEWVQVSWAGVDRYTNAPWFPEGVWLTSASGAYGGIIAEYLFGTILSLYRHLPRYVEQQREGVWQPRFPGVGLEGRTVLMLGVGDIGTEFAKRLRPFGVTIIGVRRTAADVPEWFDKMETMDALPRLLPRADLLVCALPDTPQTRGLLDEAALRAMKRDALLVNVGRGSLVNTDVLARVLESGHLMGAVLDVTQPEPLPPEHPLWRMENVLITPHVAGIGFGNVPETTEKIWQICRDNLRRYLSGQTPENLIDFKTGYRTKTASKKRLV